MDNLSVQSVTAVTCFLLCMIKADNSFFQLSTSSNTATFAPNESVTFKCTVLTSRTAVSNGVQWFRRQDTVSLVIASETTLWYDFFESGRYSFSRGSVTSTTADYYLTITNLQLEDSSTIECGIPRFTQRASLAFAVCASPGNQVCDCMTKTGWSSPACFDDLINAQRSYDSNRKSAIGLGVAVAVAIIASVCLTVCVVKDCVTQTRTREKTQETTAPLPPVPLAPPGASVLKQHAGGTTVIGHGASVRFSDDGDTATRIPANGHRGFVTADRFSDGIVANTPPNGNRAQFHKESADKIGQSYNKTGQLYPSFGAAPSDLAQNYGYAKPNNEVTNYFNSYEISPPRYLQAQDTLVPDTIVLSNAAPRTESFSSSRVAFIDPGSTSI